MGMLGKLIVEVGADIKGLTKGIREAERVMQQSGKTLGAAAASLTQAISIPLAGIGVGAIKAAADLERLSSALETTMQNAGRSTEDARKELDALRKAALAPGLDFEQAVKGSVRLQNVGFSAEQARKILVQLANAISMTGGTAAELDGVTRQFSQMLAKGRILQEDLTIIQENMPAISKAMEDAFGTRSADKLRELGITAEQFVTGVVGQFEKLPRVSGGLSNSIVNAFTAMKTAAADLGQVLNERLNISGNLNKFGDWLTGLAAKFRALSPEAKDMVIAIGAFALALGPAIKVGSLFVSAIGGISVAIAQMRLAMAAVQGGGFIAWFQSLNAVTKANVIGAVVGVVIALAAAFATLSEDTSAAAQAARSVTEVNKKAADSIADEKVKVEQLTKIVMDNTVSMDARKKALSELQALAPKHFGNLDLEKSKMEDISKATDNYITGLLRAAKAQAAFEQIKDIEKQMNNLKEASEPSFWQKAGNAIAGLGNPMAIAGRNAKTMADNMAENKTALEAQRKALEDVMRANADEAGTIEIVSGKTKTNTDAQNENNESKGKGAKATKDLRTEFEKYLDKISASEKANDDFRRKLEETTSAVAEIGKKPIDLLPVNTEAGLMAVQKVNEVMKEATARVNTHNTAVKLLSATLTDDNSTLNERAQALNTLQGYSKEYFGSLEVGKSTVDDVRGAVKNYTDALISAERAQAAFQQVKVITQQIDNLRKIGSVSIDGPKLNAADVQKTIAGLTAQKTALDAIIQANTALLPRTNALNAAMANEAPAEALRKLNEQIALLQSTGKLTVDGPKLDAAAIATATTSLMAQKTALEANLKATGGLLPQTNALNAALSNQAPAEALRKLNEQIALLQSTGKLTVDGPKLDAAAIATATTSLMAQKTALEANLKATEGLLPQTNALNTALSNQAPAEALRKLNEQIALLQSTGKLTVDGPKLDAAAIATATTSLMAQKTAIEASIRANESLVPAITASNAAFGDSGPVATLAQTTQQAAAGLSLTNSELQQYAQGLRDAAAAQGQLGSVRMPAPIEAPTMSVGVSTDGSVNAATAGIQKTLNALQSVPITAAAIVPPTQAALTALNTGVMKFGEIFTLVGESVAESGNAMQMSVMSAAMNMQQFAEQGGTSFAAMGRNALAGAAKVVRAYIMQGVAAAASKALVSVPFPFNIAIAGGAGAAAGVLFNKLISSIGVPKFADGGIITGPTLGLMGEYPGARSNPEVVAPLNRLESIMGGGNRDVNVSGQFRIQGTDLVVALERGMQKQNRIRGY